MAEEAEERGGERAWVGSGGLSKTRANCWLLVEGFEATFGAKKSGEAAAAPARALMIRDEAREGEE